MAYAIIKTLPQNSDTAKLHKKEEEFCFAKLRVFVEPMEVAEATEALGLQGLECPSF